MSDKVRNAPATTSKAFKSRPSTVSVSSRNRIPSTTTKDRGGSRIKNNKNTTILGDGDVTVGRLDGFIPDFDAENREVAYGKFLRAMLVDCLVDDKIEREETQMDKDMALLADRFQKTVTQLEKTNNRLKDISFVVEQNRLLDMKRQDCFKLYEMTDSSDMQVTLHNLASTEQANLDKLITKNVDLGYDKSSGYKQLLDAVNDAIEGLEDIKKHSNLDLNKFKEYEKSQTCLQDVERNRMDLETLKADFEAKFPKLNEKLLKEASEKLSKMIDSDGEE